MLTKFVIPFSKSCFNWLNSFRYINVYKYLLKIFSLEAKKNINTKCYFTCLYIARTRNSLGVA